MMDNLEKYIQDNLEQFSCGEMQEGHKERFLARLADTQAVNTEAVLCETQDAALRRTPHLFSRKAIFAAATAAAAIIIALVAPWSTRQLEDEYTITIQELAQQMYMEEAQTLMLFSEEDQYMVTSVKSITNEAIPLSDQLPNELSPAQRVEILREYYKAKTAALKTIKTLYAQSGQPIE
jgi:hypothetical protein